MATDNPSTRDQKPGDAARPNDTLDRDQNRGRRAPKTGSGAVKGSGAPEADYASDPQGGNSGGLNPTGQGAAQARRQKTNRTSA